VFIGNDGSGGCVTKGVWAVVVRVQVSMRAGGIGDWWDL
jgi:hypothetical protein